MKNETKSFSGDVATLLLPVAIVLLIGGFLGGGSSADEAKFSLQREVILPATWGDLGKRLTDAGVIDGGKFRSAYEMRGEFSEEYEKLLSGADGGRIKMTKKNSGYVLNMLWALGLGNKNPILYYGEMADERYGGPGNFASTAGWTMAKGNAMDHYGMHELVVLSPEEQNLVERVSGKIYRPCCENTAHFPDCNHGMAMLGLLELMAKEGATEREMMAAAFAANSFWFPDAYANIDKYLKIKKRDHGISPKVLLGAKYSSLSGYKKILSGIETPVGSAKGSC